MFRILTLIILGSAVAGVLAVTAGIGVTLLMASFFAKPAVLLMSGGIIFLAVFALASRLLLRIFGRGKNRVYRIIPYSIGLILMASMVFGLLIPLSNEGEKPKAVEGQQFWNLPSGLKISYIYLQGKDNGKITKPPVIFLHGGPGVPDLFGDSDYFGQLTSDGYDVYVYDQIGSGGSSRLEDPRGYTVQRDVEDLEFIRQKIEAEKVILIGHSYGGEIAAHYMAAYPDRVDKVVFSSPGAINPEDTSDGNLTNRLTSKEKKVLFKALLYPRNLMAYTLLQINPLAAKEFAGDAEMDAQFDKIYKYTQSALHSRGLPLGPKLSNLGFYAHQAPQAASAETEKDIRKALAGKSSPALIIKGSSDYLSWSSAMDYKKALPNSIVVYFSGAGHNVYQDVPEAFMKTLRAFLNDRSIQEAVYTSLEPPADYEGVR